MPRHVLTKERLTRANGRHILPCSLLHPSGTKINDKGLYSASTENQDECLFIVNESWWTLAGGKAKWVWIVNQDGYVKTREWGSSRELCESWSCGQGRHKAWRDFTLNINGSWMLSILEGGSVWRAQNTAVARFGELCNYFNVTRRQAVYCRIREHRYKKY